MRLQKGLLLAGFFILPVLLRAQNCIPTNINGAVLNFPCTRSCPDLIFQIPHIKSTDNYIPVNIPYEPYAYVTPSGNELVETYIDDQFSHLNNLPFTVCFFGSLFNSFVAGSNGVISFDASQANCRNAWPLYIFSGVPQPVPFVGSGTCSDKDTRKYPRFSVMGPYHDLNPSVIGVSPQRKIEWRVEGSAPCRKLVVSFYRIPLYGDNFKLNTHQVVIHESTGLVDVFIESKLLDGASNPWNSNFAILGLQKDDTKAVTAAGKNCTVWNESNTGYRFIPSAGTSRYVISQLFTMSGTLLATADTSTVTQGLLNIKFPGLCVPKGVTNYVIKTTFSACDNAAIQLVSADTITVNRAPKLDVVATVVNTDCGPPNGSVTLSVPSSSATPPFTYVLDGGTPVVAGTPYTFNNLSQGTHIVSVTETGGCDTVLNIMVNRNNSLTANVSTTATACAEVGTGTITVTPTNGTGPYTFKLDTNIPLPGAVPFIFNNVYSGTHTIVVTDVTGCQTNNISVNVPAAPGVSAITNSSPAACTMVNNGSITLTATAGIAPFSWQLDGGGVMPGANPFQFTAVSGGAHSVTVYDNVGCQKTYSVIVATGSGVDGNIVFTPASCQLATNATITVNATHGTAPFDFQLDGGPVQTGSNPYTFINQTGGPHFITITDNVGCRKDFNISIPAGNGPVSSAVAASVSCNGLANGSITVTVASGAPPYLFSLDGGPPVSGASPYTFAGLSPGNHNIQVTDAAGCTGNRVDVIISEPALLAATTNNSAVKCNGESNGVITVNISGGTSPFQYSIDGGLNWQLSNTFIVPAGSYTISVQDANGCTTTLGATVTEPPPLTASSVSANASCDGGNDGQITVSANGGNSVYQYSLDGVVFQASNVFNVSPGSYTVTVKDNLGCRTSFTAIVGLTVNLFMNPLRDTSICEGTSGQLQLVTNANVFNWSPALGLNNTTISNPIANPSVTTQYIVSATLGRCSANDTALVHVYPAPVPDAGPDGNICYGDSYTLQGSGGVQYTWSPALYLNSTTGPRPVSTPTLTTIYNLAVTDINGCKSLFTDGVTVIVKKPVRVITYPFDTVAYPGQQIPLLATSAGINYVWSPATGLNNTTIANPVATAGNIGNDITYQVIATTSDGCKGEGYVRIRISKGPDVYVPTAFTPNDDGLNDKFTPRPVGIKAYKVFKVFNRWGQLVFSTKTQNEGWDGKMGGKEQPDGIYVWMIEVVTHDNRIISKKGTVTLIR